MPLPSNSYSDAAKQAADKHGVPAAVLFGTIQQESGWNPSASNANANGTVDYGIAQLNTKYYPDAWFMTPEEQIDKAASILADNYKQSGTWYDAVRAYNAGATGAATNQNAGKEHADKVFGYISQWGEKVEDKGGVLGTDSANPFDYIWDGLKDAWGLFTGKKEAPDFSSPDVKQQVMNSSTAVLLFGLGVAVVLFSTGTAFKSVK